MRINRCCAVPLAGIRSTHRSSSLAIPWILLDSTQPLDPSGDDPMLLWWQSGLYVLTPSPRCKYLHRFQRFPSGISFWIDLLLTENQIWNKKNSKQHRGGSARFIKSGEVLDSKFIYNTSDCLTASRKLLGTSFPSTRPSISRASTRSTSVSTYVIRANSPLSMTTLSRREM